MEYYVYIYLFIIISNKYNNNKYMRALYEEAENFAIFLTYTYLIASYADITFYLGSLCQ